MTQYAERLIDTLDTGCKFSQDQREKLLLAAKLDILKFKQHSPAANLPVQTEALVMNQFRIFNDPSSHFQRVLRGGLLDEQKQKLAEAARERYKFQRRATIEAALVGFERAAALTARQCQALWLMLNEALDEPDDERIGHSRAACAQRLRKSTTRNWQLSSARFNSPLVKRCQLATAEAARQFEAQRVTKSSRIGNSSNDKKSGGDE